MSPKYRRPRLMFICEEDTKNFLETWAKSDNRTVSNLIGNLIEEAVATKKSGNSDKEALTVALDIIKTMIEGKQPTLAQIAKLGHETDIKEEDLLKLRDRLA